MRDAQSARRDFCRMAGGACVASAPAAGFAETPDDPGGRSLASRSVKFYGAKGDGKTDDTRAVQTALDKAGERGGAVWLPEGRYRIGGVLSVPEGVTLEGVWRGPHESHLDKGSTLLAYAGRDHENGSPFLSLRTSSALKGVTIFYPEQRANDVRPYPWTIQGRGFHFSVIDTTLANAYNGIDCGSFVNELHHLRNVGICALSKGVFIDQCSDIGRVENVHIHTRYWARLTGAPSQLLPKDELPEYLKAHLTGFLIGRTDWEYMSGCFVIFARTGFHFLRGKSGSANVLLTQSGSDIGPLAVKIDEVQSHAGVAFENCQFMSGFEIGPQNKGPVKLSNCGFWGQAAAGSQMVLDGEGTVTLAATHFQDWDESREGKSCIQARNGSLLIHGCDFAGQPKIGPHLHLGKRLRSAAVIGNRFWHGEIRILNESEGKTEILGNVAL
ncbi:MAG: hypothetical protein HY235_17095 [Acidobacteria bacterium]|nr:hypothetical protein [Acidobacteriota bacterium]